MLNAGKAQPEIFTKIVKIGLRKPAKFPKPAVSCVNHTSKTTDKTLKEKGDPTRHSAYVARGEEGERGTH